MLQVILWILKILLWIILAILGLVLLVVLLVLFSPIKYKIDAKYHGAALVYARISFLIATVRVMFDQDKKKLDYSISLAGIKLNLGKGKKPKKEKKKDNAKNEDIANLQNIDENVTDATDDAMDAKEPSNNSDIAGFDDRADTVDAADTTDTTDTENVDSATDTDDVDSATDTTDVDDTADTDDTDETDDIEAFDLFDDDIDRDVPKEQQNLLGRIKALLSGFKNKLINLKQKAEEFSPEQLEHKIDSKVDKIRRNVNKFKRFWNLKCTVKTRQYLKKYLIGLVKHVGPRSIKGYVRYGFGDPCKTGQITGYLSLLPFVYSKHFSLEPDFYEKIIDTELLIKGRIRIGYILRIVLNINIWRTILVARKIFSKKVNGKKREV